MFARTNAGQAYATAQTPNRDQTAKNAKGAKKNRGDGYSVTIGDRCPERISNFTILLFVFYLGVLCVLAVQVNVAPITAPSGQNGQNSHIAQIHNRFPANNL
jgi:hypothetical protein